LRHHLFRCVVSVLLFVSLVCQGTLVLAGTTGSLSGTVTDASTHAPLAGAKVTVTSPSQTTSVTTDSTGHFNFLALAPDTYLVSVTLAGYDQSTVSGTTVIADANRQLAISASKTLQTIGKVTSRSSTDLVKPGTTADVYSVNATQQDKAAALGGGGALNTAFSALATVPGAFVPSEQAGYNASFAVSIRGGDYDQVGYEIDGVPVNRAFDQYPSGVESSLGQQELQVYTGAAPASAEGQGLSGFVNQVIKTGTYPASTTLTGDIGAPTYYHKFSIETGGATADRNFSYYIGLGGYNQDSRYADQFNGASLSQYYGTPIAPCSGVPAANLTPKLVPSCFTNGVPNFNSDAGGFVLGGYNTFDQSGIANRDSVFNFHIGLPHKDGTKDDIQFLLDVNHLATSYYDSTNDLGGAAFLNAIGYGQPTYADGYQYNGPTGVTVANFNKALVSQYFFPESGDNRAFGGDIPVNERDGISNDQNIFKAQYTHAIGTNALLKLYGYTYFSDWLQQGPQTGYADYFGPSGPDYELSAHTRGASGTFTDQIGSNDTLNLQASYTTSSTLRDNNTQMFNGGGVGARSVIGVLVDGTGGKDGLCYTPAGIPTTCSYDGPAQFATIAQAYAGSVAPAPAGFQYLVTNNGQYATYNTVEPKFTTLSLDDTFKPTNKITLEAGVHFDYFGFQGSDTTGTAARAFWYNAYNLDNCLNSQHAIFDKVLPVASGGLGLASPNAACPAGYTAANFVNPTGIVSEGYSRYQPRLGLTYSLDPSTVFRANYGRFAQAPSSASQQYDALQQNAPALLYGTYGFQKFGFTSPDHSVVPPTSDNLDFSIEHQFGRDTSVKITPFLRKTQDQIQSFFLNQQTGFVSGLNVGSQTSQGVEFELDKGDFGRNGFAGKLSLAYTNSFIKYGPLSNGSSIIDPLNAQIKDYNAYTSTCAKNPNLAPCAGATTTTGVAAAPCYTPTVYSPTTGAYVSGGAAVPVGACTAADIANPYWDAPVQGLLDPNGDYPTFDLFPAGIGSAVDAYGAPYTATLLLQYKHDRLAITPSFQFYGGVRYGAPATTLGVAPETCAGIVGATGGDPRYNYGAAGGSAYDYSACGQLPGGIPDASTGKFDSLGAFSEPSVFQANLQIAYDITKRISLVVNLANLYNDCFGGTKTSFTVKGACTYSVVANGATGAAGNTYNPGSPIQPYVNTPYEPVFNNLPFGVFVSARVKL
jgi:hypothetical protein